MYHRTGNNGSRRKGKSGAGIVFSDGRYILLLRKADGEDEGKWGLPGGAIEEGETPIDAAIREVKEECQVSDIPGRRYDKFEETDGSFTWTSFFYGIDKPFECDLSEEHDAYEWVPLNKVRMKELHPKFEKHFDTYRNRIESHFKNLGFREWLEQHGDMSPEEADRIMKKQMQWIRAKRKCKTCGMPIKTMANGSSLDMQMQAAICRNPECPDHKKLVEPKDTKAITVLGSLGDAFPSVSDIFSKFKI